MSLVRLCGSSRRHTSCAFSPQIAQIVSVYLLYWYRSSNFDTYQGAKVSGIAALFFEEAHKERDRVD
jgi:hypothetical protein